jgi:CubicO group peptidase (beta-lactamase class C family)
MNELPANRETYHMKKTILIVLIGILFSCNVKSSKEKASMQESLAVADSLTIELNKIYKQGHINGLSVSIVNEHKTLYQNGFGFSDIKAKKAYTENTIQNIASISKTLLGVSLLKAQEMGKLNLNDPIEKYLPFKVKNPYHPELPITINHLATHTSTIKDTEFYDKSYVLKDDFGKLDIDIPMKEFLKDILTTDGKLYKKDGFLKNKPGELFEYTNIGATLAAIVLEMATGEKYDDFTTKYILKPYKMSNSGWSFNAIDVSKYSMLYKTDQTEYPRYKLITYPDGGFITSVNDLSLFLSELIRGYSGSGSLLSAESYKTLFKEQLGEDNFIDRGARDYSDEYNTGIFMGFTPNGHIGHTGGDPGVSTFMFFNPKTKLGRILIVNTDLEEEGWQQFIDIWNKLDGFSARLK